MGMCMWRMYKCEHLGMSMCAHTKARERHEVSCPITHSLHYFLDTGSLTEMDYFMFLRISNTKVQKEI